MKAQKGNDTSTMLVGVTVVLGLLAFSYKVGSRNGSGRREEALDNSNRIHDALKRKIQLCKEQVNEQVEVNAGVCIFLIKQRVINSKKDWGSAAG